MSKPHIASFQNQLGDFSASPRLLLLAGMAIVAGICGADSAYVLLKLIALCTNLAYFQSVSFVTRSFPASLPLWTIAHVEVTASRVTMSVAYPGYGGRVTYVIRSTAAPLVGALVHAWANRNRRAALRL